MFHDKVGVAQVGGRSRVIGCRDEAVVQPSDLVRELRSDIDELYALVFHDSLAEAAKFSMSVDLNQLTATSVGVGSTVVGNGATALHMYGSFDSMPWAFANGNLQMASQANSLNLANSIVGGIQAYSDGNLPLQQMVGLASTWCANRLDGGGDAWFGSRGRDGWRRWFREHLESDAVPAYG